jgi:hypothetical protein
MEAEFLLGCTGHPQNWRNKRGLVHTNRNSGIGGGMEGGGGDRRVEVERHDIVVEIGLGGGGGH